jgi:anti-sigma factor RsiW/cytoskeletal protein CcmA (bactofilin family)
MLMMYADDELGEPKRREVDTHLGSCARCRAHVAAFRVETRVLAEAIREDGIAGGDFDHQGQRAAVRPPRVFPAAAALLVTAGMARALVEWAPLTSTAWLPDWLNPFESAGRANLFFNLLVYTVQEGEAIMSSLVTTAGFIALGVLSLSTTWTVWRLRMRGLAGVIALGVLLPATPAQALDVRRGQTIRIPANETIDDTLVVVGDSIEIEGIVTGDVVAFARRVRVRGTVRGNLVTGGRDVEVEGAVEGSILQFGQTLTTRGRTNGNLYAFGQSVNVPGGAAIGGNATTFSETATIEGRVDRDVTSFGRAVDLDGTVSRRVIAYADRVDVGAGARINGSLTAHVRSRENVRVDPDAIIGGATSIELQEAQPSRYLTFRYYLRQCIRLAAAFVTGWVLFWLVPRAARIGIDTGGALLTAAGAGAVAACATPVLAVLAGITIVGLPIAFFALLVWLALLYIAKILLALILGRMVLGTNGSSSRNTAAALFLGLTIVLIAINIPYVGGVINLLLTITGFGVAVVHLAQWYKGSQGVPAHA